MANLDVPWVEKYRPETFDDIVSQNLAIRNLKKFVESGEMPHMIFTGPAGTGKTSTALIIARYLLKGDQYQLDVLELNASDTVRMDFVRDVLKDFVNSRMIIGEDTLKIVILDEADNIPTTVQQALRRIIEKSSTSVKFILMCNYINRIIDPIISRCAVFRFVKLSKEKIIERLRYIVQQEKLSIPTEKEDKFYEILYFISEGDLRKAINALQMSVALELLDGLEIGELLEVSGFLDEQTLNGLVDALNEGNLGKARDVLSTIDVIDGRNLIRQFTGALPQVNDLSSRAITELMAIFGEVDYRLSQGADERIQISSLMAEIIERVRKA